jgi:hypothetical protein
MKKVISNFAIGSSLAGKVSTKPAQSKCSNMHLANFTCGN